MLMLILRLLILENHESVTLSREVKVLCIFKYASWNWKTSSASLSNLKFDYAQVFIASSSILITRI